MVMTKPIEAVLILKEALDFCLPGKDIREWITRASKQLQEDAVVWEIDSLIYLSQPDSAFIRYEVFISTTPNPINNVRLLRRDSSIKDARFDFNFAMNELLEFAIGNAIYKGPIEFHDKGIAA